MKKEYPTYAKGDMTKLYNQLSTSDKKIFDKFMIFVSSSAGKLKQNDRRKDILQVRDIIGKPYDKFTFDDVVGFCAVLNKSDRKPWTKKGTLTSLSVYLKWKYKDWSLRFNELNVLKKLSRQIKPDNSDRYNDKTLPTPEEIDKLIRAAKNVRDKLYISLAVEGGLPPAVELNLKFENFKVDYPEDNILTLSYVRGKNKGKFVIPLKTSSYYFKQWKQEYCYPNVTDNDYLFPSPQDRNKPITLTSIQSMLTRLQKNVGLNKHIHQYLFRHKTLSDSYSELTEEVHRKIYGHVAGSRQTATYSHQDDEDKILRKALQKLHNLEEVNNEEAKSLRAEIKELKKNMKKEIREEVKKHLKGYKREMMKSVSGLN